MPYADPEKQKAYFKARYWANRDEAAVRSKEYRDKNKERLSAQAKEYYQTNREHLIARATERAKANVEQISEYQTQYRETNKEKLEAQHKEYRAKNRAEIRARGNEYKEKNRAALREKQKAYRITNITEIRALRRAAHHTKKHDPNYRMRHNLSKRIYKVLRGINKSKKTLELLGCSLEFFWAYLEKQFAPGMTRENYGPVWHVDHILPCAEFHLQHSEEQEICFHWTNLQPLFAADNLSKSDKII